MQEAFEKNIEQQLKSFQLQPSDTVWQEVEHALHAKKRRVVPFWWFSAAVLLIACLLATVLFFDSNHSKINNSNSNLVAAKKETIKAYIPIFKVKESEKPTNSNYNKTKTITPINNELAAKKNNKSKANNTNHSIKNTTTKKGTSYNTATQTNYFTEKDAIATISASTPIYEVNTKFTEADLVKIDLHIQQNFNQLPLNIPVNQNQYLTALSKQNTIKIAKPKQWFWNTSVGLLEQKSSLFNNEKMLADANNLFQSGSGVSSVNPSNTNVSTQNGIAFSVGAGFSKPINLHWNYTIGLQYKFFHSAQQLSNDTATNPAISNANNFINYYPGGTVTKVNNKLHAIQLPIMLQYIVNPKHKGQVQLNVGSSIAYALYSNWLITDKNTNRYYYNTSYNNNLFINLQAGISYKYNQQFSIELMTEKSLSPIHKQVATKQYFSQFYVQFSKFIKAKK